MRTVHAQSLRTFVVILRRLRRRAATDQREAASAGIHELALTGMQVQAAGEHSGLCLKMRRDIYIYIYIYIYI